MLQASTLELSIIIVQASLGGYHIRINRFPNNSTIMIYKFPMYSLIYPNWLELVLASKEQASLNSARL